MFPIPIWKPTRPQHCGACTMPRASQSLVFISVGSRSSSSIAFSATTVTSHRISNHIIWLKYCLARHILNCGIFIRRSCWLTLVFVNLTNFFCYQTKAISLMVCSEKNILIFEFDDVRPQSRLGPSKAGMPWVMGFTWRADWLGDCVAKQIECVEVMSRLAYIQAYGLVSWSIKQLVLFLVTVSQSDW